MVTTEHAKRRIVVGVNESASSRAAVIWAAKQASRRRCDLIITHIDPAPSDSTRLQDATSSHLLLAASANAASLRQPTVPVTSLLLGGAISDELIQLSSAALLLVTGVDEARPRGSGGAIGPIEDRVVMHAGCPVVTISGRWDGTERPERDVVVGWTDDPSGWRAMQVAASEAQLRSASLIVVTIDTQLPAPSVKTRKAAPDRPASLADAVDSIHKTHRGLRIDLDQSDPDTDHLQALIRHAERAELMVIGCPLSDDRWSIRVGVTAATLMRRAACPVMLVGQPGATYSSRQIGANTASDGPADPAVGAAAVLPTTRLHSLT